MSLFLALLLVGTNTVFSMPSAATAPAQEQAIQVFAYLDTDELERDGEYEFVVALKLPSGSSASKSGAPAPFLQLDVPASIKLTERELTTYKQLSDNEFLQMPYERLLEAGEVAIPFKVIGELAPGDVIGMNVLAYVHGEKEGEEYFFRRRLELALKPGAEATLAQGARATKSDWGNDKALLQIGRKAAPFLLPNAQGELISSEEYLGKYNLIVTTYRAHW